jgi:hypothetical protein
MFGRLYHVLRHTGFAPAFPALAIVILALGIGMHTLLFSIGLAAGTCGTLGTPARHSSS